MNPTDRLPATDRFENRPIFWLTALIVFAAFFLANHDVTVSLSDAFTSTADEMEAQAAGGNIIRRMAFLALAAAGCLGIALPARRQFDRLRPLRILLLVFFGWCVASCLWSDVPSMTLRRVLVLTCLGLGAVGIARQLTLREVVHLSWIVPAAGLVIGISAEVALSTFRPWAEGYRFSGSLHPNTQGISLAAMCLAAFCLGRDGRWQNRGYLLLLGIGLVFLVLTKSRTSLAGLLLAITLLLTLRTASELKWSAALGGLWIATTAAVLVMLLGIDVEEQLTQTALLGRTEQAESLTGRLPIWTTLADYVAQRPLIGYGYDSFWTPDRIDTISAELQWGLKEAHNGYLETVLSVGLVGGILLLLIVFCALQRSGVQYLNTGNPRDGFLLGLLVFGLVNACTESGMVMPMFVPFLAGVALVQTAMVRAESRTRRVPAPSVGKTRGQAPGTRDEMARSLTDN